MGSWQEAKCRLERSQLIVEGAAWCSTASFWVVFVFLIHNNSAELLSSSAAFEVFEIITVLFLLTQALKLFVTTSELLPSSAKEPTKQAGCSLL